MPVNYYTYSHESSRLKMRPLVEEDATFWENFMQDADATALFPDFLKPPQFTAIDWIAGQLKRYKNQQMGLLALIDKSTGEFVGMAGLLEQMVEDQKEIEVGYHLLPKYWHNGYAREAARYFLKFGFTVYKPESIISLINCENVASQRVAMHNGLSSDKRVIERHGASTYVYRISLEDWKSRMPDW